MPAPHDLLREYARLNRLRKGDGISPLEYQRWLDLRGRLERTFAGRSAPGAGGRSHMVVDFANRMALADATMFNVRPIGLFIGTPFAPEEGTRLELTVRVKETGEVYQTPVLVVSNNLGPDFSTATLGMGVRFASAECELARVLDELCREEPGASA